MSVKAPAFVPGQNDKLSDTQSSPEQAYSPGFAPRILSPCQQQICTPKKISASPSIPQTASLSAMPGILGSRLVGNAQQALVGQPAKTATAQANSQSVKFNGKNKKSNSKDSDASGKKRQFDNWRNLSSIGTSKKQYQPTAAYQQAAKGSAQVTDTKSNEDSPSRKQSQPPTGAERQTSGAENIKNLITQNEEPVQIDQYTDNEQMLAALQIEIEPPITRSDPNLDLN
jgi:hypothetical protein